jgi:Gram-negative bacterial TonB protein C-terminal
VILNEVPQLLVEWSSPWQEFVSAVGPALRRSPPKLNIEARAGLFPWRGILLTLLLEVAAALATAIVHPIESTALAALEERPRSHDVIFFSANELPRTEDLGGAPGGSEGSSGGASTHHAVQTIKVARGQSLRERVIDAPQLNLPKSDSAIKNLLAYKAGAGPASAETLPLAKRTPQLMASVAPPLPELRSELRRPQLAQPQVAPPPVELPQPSSARRNLPVANAVVPPPVSAPPQALSHPSRLTLPEQAVVGTRPDMNVPIRSGAQATGFQANVVPPPVELNNARSHSSGGLTGNQVVVPPPVELNSVRTHAQLGRLNGNHVVAPPPVDLQNLPQHAGGTLGNASVAPPPVNLNSRLQVRPSLPGSSPVAAPAESSSSKSTETKTSTAGVIASPKPGDKAAQPAKPEPAMLAMSPAGTNAGTGSAGGGTGAARGSRSGSSSTGTGSGASFAGAGNGADASPRTGTSSYAGPGGSGDRYNGAGRVPGVSVSGGNNVVTLPSFGGAEPSAGGRSDVHKNSNGITVVASPRAGGAMNFYGALKGDRVYTIYFKTGAGMVSLQFADPESAAHPYTEDLVSPQALRTDVSADIPRARLVIKCVLDRSGVLKNVSILQSAGGEFEKQVLAALPDWKFSPAFRGSEPVEVNAILGFGIDTK